jgi:hypothetical protein
MMHNNNYERKQINKPTDRVRIPSAQKQKTYYSNAKNVVYAPVGLWEPVSRFSGKTGEQQSGYHSDTGFFLEYCQSNHS